MDTGVEGLREATLKILNEIIQMNRILSEMNMILDARLGGIEDNTQSIKTEIQKFPREV